MFFRKIFPIVLCFFPLTIGGEWHQDVFYEEINTFRHSPIAYQQNHTDLVVRCSFPLDETYPPLQVVEALENSSYFQAYTLSMKDCPISHETCDLYCDLFPSCSYMDRIGSYIGSTTHHNILEILIQGPKNPYKIFHHFLASEPHCNHMINPHINSMGAYFHRIDRNVFVADFAYISN